MDQENFAKLLAAKYWPTMVVKHTVGGSCNFQQAANELAEFVSAAERERCAELTDDMLRYAMAAMSTGSPKDADKFRRFWRFAIEARNTNT